MPSLHHSLGDNHHDTEFNTIPRKLMHYLEGTPVEIALLVLMLIDIINVSITVTLSTVFNFHLEAVPSMEACTWPKAHFYFKLGKLLSKITTLIFASDITLKAILMPLQFFSHPGEVIDLLLIAFSILIKFYFSRFQYTNLIIILRIWRILRVIRGIYGSVHHVVKAKHEETPQTKKRRLAGVANYQKFLRKHKLEGHFNKEFDELSSTETPGIEQSSDHEETDPLISIEEAH